LPVPRPPRCVGVPAARRRGCRRATPPGLGPVGGDGPAESRPVAGRRSARRAGRCALGGAQGCCATVRDRSRLHQILHCDKAMTGAVPCSIAWGPACPGAVGGTAMDVLPVRPVRLEHRSVTFGDPRRAPKQHSAPSVSSGGSGCGSLWGCPINTCSACCGSSIPPTRWGASPVGSSLRPLDEASASLRAFRSLRLRGCCSAGALFRCGPLAPSVTLQCPSGA
jgi:hypothetical protein